MATVLAIYGQQVQANTFIATHISGVLARGNRMANVKRPYMSELYVYLSVQGTKVMRNLTLNCLV